MSSIWLGMAVVHMFCNIKTQNKSTHIENKIWLNFDNLQIQSITTRACKNSKTIFNVRWWFFQRKRWVARTFIQRSILRIYSVNYYLVRTIMTKFSPWKNSVEAWNLWFRNNGGSQLSGVIFIYNFRVSFYITNRDVIIIPFTIIPCDVNRINWACWKSYCSI